MDRLESILKRYREGRLEFTQAGKEIEELFYKDLGHSVVDTHREERTGFSEVIYCEGKSPKQIKDILSYCREKKANTLATRMPEELYRQVQSLSDSSEPRGEETYHREARLMTLRFSPPQRRGKGTIAVVSAGTSDFPVAEEAALTAEFYGNEVLRFNDVGVAGIHRLLYKMEIIREARVVVVVAGMEGALASVVGGLVRSPVIAVPTSVGYGANFQGISALLAMLNSCASGTAVVNIDNGFGAGYMASTINALD
jgi:hypothetical protein